MRLALAAVLACGSAENATNPRPRTTSNGTTSNETTTSEPTPAPATHAPTPWSARPFSTRREDNRTSCQTTVEQCRKAYPQLLRRIDWDLAPWRLGGITPNATQLRYDEAVGNSDQMSVSVRGGRAHVQRWGRGYKSRSVTAQNMITQSLERVCGVPAVSSCVELKFRAPHAIDAMLAP